MIHLNTSFLIRAMTPKSTEDGRLRRWLVSGESIGISAMSWAEFPCGPVEAGDVAVATRIVGDPVALLGADGPLIATLFNLGGRRPSRIA